MNKKIMAIGLSFSLFASSFVFFIMPASAALQAVGPASATHGFPSWYADSTGLRLEPCLGTNLDGSGPADPNCVVLPDASYDGINPISFPTNFPGEFFYYIADADPIAVGPALGDTASFRMALEGTFTGAPAAGTQITFIRIRLQQLNNLVPSSTYTVTYPFGTFTFDTDTAGIAISNAGGGATYRVEDGPGAPGDFTILLPATATNVSKFLAAVNPAAPAGYLGNPTVTQTIEAGTNGALFAIDGPDIGGPGTNHVETSLWSVAGKIATPVLNSITVTPTAPSIAVSSTQQFTATPLDQFGDPIVPVNAVVWASSDTAVGTIDPVSGLFTAVGVGSTVITATSGSVIGTTVVTVVAAAPTLSSIIIAPADYAMVYGASQQFSAIALDQYGNSLVVQPAIIWSSSDTAVGTVTNAGSFSALAVGSTIITASSDLVSATTTVSVNAPVPAPLQVSRNADGTIKVDPTNGFPAWYGDSTGLRVEPCLAGADGLADPRCVVLDAFGNTLAGQIAFPGNFPGELFYYTADSNPLNIGPALSGSAKFRIALEGTFAGGVPAAGQQATFLRINLQQVNGLSPNSAYTVTHPFGTFVFHTDGNGSSIGEGNAGGRGTAFRNEDGSGAAGDFTALLPATATNITKFLAAVSPAASAGYLGDPAILQTIEAGTQSASFRIDGPNVGGIGIHTISTDQWSVAGKVLANTVPVIAPLVDQTAAVGSPFTLTVAATDAEADPITYAVTPVTNIGNEAAAVISPATGVFSWTPTTAGVSSFTVSASDGSLIATASVLVTVTPLPLPPADTVPPVIALSGVTPIDVIQNATYIDAGATATDNVDPTVTVITTGTVDTAVVGAYTLTYSASDAAGNAATPVTRTINVVAATPVAATVVVTNAAPAITVGATQPLSAAVIDPAGTAVTPAPVINFTSTAPAVATVDAAGIVTAVAPGTTTITATAGGFTTGTTAVTVVDPAPAPVLTTVSIVTAAPTVVAGTQQQVSVAAIDQVGTALATPPAPIILTSANPAVATVDQATGVVTAVAPGTTTITADCGGTIATVTVTVVAAPVIEPVVTAIEIVPDAVTLEVNATTTLHARVLDQNNQEIHPTPAIDWSSSNSAVATIGSHDIVTGISAGTALITAAIGQISTTSTVTVNAVVVPPTDTEEPPITPVLTSMEAVPSSLNLHTGSSTTITIIALDQNDNSIDTEVVWSSSDRAVARVNGSGMVTAVTPGSATITASSGSVSVTVEVEVSTSASQELTGDDALGSELEHTGAFLSEDGDDYASTTALTATRDIRIRLHSSDDGDDEIVVPSGVKISREDGSSIDGRSLTVATTTLAGSRFLEVDTSLEVKGAVQWGVSSTTLHFSQPITLKIFVGNDLNGQTVRIRRSANGVNGWTNDGIVLPATSVVANGFATFQATKASFFVAALPAPVPTPAPAPASEPAPVRRSSGGGGGGGGGRAGTPVGAAPSVATVTTTATITSAQGQVLGATFFIFAKNLAVGMHKADVAELQKFLIDNGFSIPAGVTGFFGAQTKAAVIKFQRDHSIIQTGFVGPLTRDELNRGKGSGSVSSGPGRSSGLNSSQVDSIIAVLQSFGADQSTVTQVRLALGK